MLTDDFIIEQSRMVIRYLRTVLCDPAAVDEDTSKMQFTGVQAALQQQLLALIQQSSYNQAEDLLFDEIEADNQMETLRLGLWYYANLLLVEEQELESHGYGKDEILEGLHELEQRTFL